MRSALTKKAIMANLNSGNLRILCLHDDESNAMELSDTLEILGERLFEKYGIDLIYVNAPLISSSSSRNIFLILIV